jgi:predicted DsbA family dithiol-disulfide isomerase
LLIGFSFFIRQNSGKAFGCYVDMSTKIRIDIVSDVVCPWCYVGKRNLEKALSGLPEVETDVHWHPFQLDPTVPEEGVDRQKHYAEKFGSIERFSMLEDRVVQAGANAGISFDFENQARIPNTLKLHALIREAEKDGFSAELKQAFLSAYFEQAIDLTSTKEIVKILEKFGWSAEKTQGIIADNAIENEVIQEIRHYQNLGVSGVPFFIINNKYALSGAQPPEVFTEALTKIGEEMAEKQGDTCEVGDPNC